MLEDIDKGKLVTYAAGGLLVLAIALRLHAHGGGGGAPPATVSLAPAGGARAPTTAPAAPVRELWVDVAGAVRPPRPYKVPAGVPAGGARGGRGAGAPPARRAG